MNWESRQITFENRMKDSASHSELTVAVSRSLPHDSCEAIRLNRSFLLVTVVALSLLPLIGCVSLAPSKRNLEESSARAATEFTSHRSQFEQATFLVLASDRAAAFDVSNHQDKFYLKYFDPKTGVGFKTGFGLATGISEDGYLITAAHVVTRPYCYVVGRMDGKPTVSPGRVVYTYKKRGKEFDEELAIVHVDNHLDQNIQIGTLDPLEAEVYGCALDREAARGRGVKFIIVAGKVVPSRKPTPGQDIPIIETKLPLWKGDSGGGVLSKEGKLVGVFVGVNIPLTTFKPARIAYIPDMEQVLSIIAKDRQTARNRTNHLHQPSAVRGR